MNDSNRKLAAIVFTDIVGFTKLTAENQQMASDLLDIQRSVIKPLVESNGGKWIKEVGDGLILTFDTITNAVNCCIEIQDKARSIENLSLRIGIHLGEIIEKENDIIGDDVNVTARIEPFSAPGGIAISNKVHDAIVREDGFKSKYLGKPKLKGVGQEVKVYCIISHDLPETNLSDVSAKLEPEGFQWNIKNSIGAAVSFLGLLFLINTLFLRIGYAEKEEIPSIAILPFENKGVEADEFYAYGISSDLIGDVTSAGLIRVASLKDIEKIEFQEMESLELAKKLFVRYLAYGTLWRMDSVFQLSMEIFDTKLSKVVYTNRWQTNWDDLATIKDDLSKNILETLQIKVLQSPEFAQRINPDAYELYLKAKHKFQKRKSFDEVQIVRGLLEKATDLDSNLVEATMLLGSTYSIEGDKNKSLDIYTSSLRRAKLLNDSLLVGKCLSSIGSLYRAKGNDEISLEFQEKALDIFEKLDAKSDVAWSLYLIGWVHQYKTGIDKGMEYYQKSYEMFKKLNDRRGLADALNALGIAASVNKDHDKAIDYFLEAKVIYEELESKSGIRNMLGNLAVQYVRKKDYTKALEHNKQSFTMADELGEKTAMAHILGNISFIYTRLGDYEESLAQNFRALSIAEALKDTVYMARNYAFIAEVEGIKGNYEKAVEHLQTALDFDEKIGNEKSFANRMYRLGYYHFYKGDYDKAIKYIEMRDKTEKKIKGDSYKEDLFSKSILYLTYKKKEIDYDETEIISLLEKESMKEMSATEAYTIYQLMDDRKYLEHAHEKINEKMDLMTDDLKNKFLNFPGPKGIIDEWKKIQS